MLRAEGWKKASFSHEPDRNYSMEKNCCMSAALMLGEHRIPWLNFISTVIKWNRMLGQTSSQTT